MSKSSRTNKSAKQKQSAMLMYIGIGAAVIAAGAGGAYFYFTQRAQAIKGILGAAAAIPQEAQVVMAFNTKVEPWNKLAQFGTPASQKLISESITKSPLNSLLVQSKTEYSRDVQPWLEGYIITALVPNAAQPQAPAATLVIAPTRDRSKSDAFLSKYREALAQQGAKFTAKQYKDVTYYESPTRDPNNSVVTADIGGQYVAIATSPKLIQQAIDTYKGSNPSLAKKPIFAKIYGATNQTKLVEPLVQVYLDGEVALEFIGSQANLNLNEAAIAQSKRELDAMTLTGGTQKEGLRFEINTYLKNDNSNPLANNEAKVLNLLPQETFLLVSGVNLYQSWQSLVAQAKGNSSSAQLIDQIRKAVKDSTKLDLDQDILKWMNGEFAIAAIPNNQGILANPGFGFVAIAQASDQNAAKTALDKIDKVAQTNSGGLLPKGVDLKPKQIGDKSVITWAIGNTNVATRGTLDNNFVFWSMGDLADTFVPTPANNLPQSSSFKILTTDIPKSNGGYFYLNMTTALSLADRLLPPEVKSNPSFTEIRSVLDAINGIAVTSTNVDAKTTRLDFLFTLKPTPGN
jgi:flagellar basal body-associated protein FliL